MPCTATQPRPQPHLAHAQGLLRPVLCRGLLAQREAPGQRMRSSSEPSWKGSVSSPAHGAFPSHLLSSLVSQAPGQMFSHKTQSHPALHQPLGRTGQELKSWSCPVLPATGLKGMSSNKGYDGEFRRAAQGEDPTEGGGGVGEFLDSKPHAQRLRGTACRSAVSTRRSALLLHSLDLPSQLQLLPELGVASQSQVSRFPCPAPPLGMEGVL